MTSPKTTPALINVEEVHASLDKPTLLHFTAEQWNSLLKSAKEAEVTADLLKKQVFITGFPIPSGNGSVLAAVDGCSENCSGKWLFLSSRMIPDCDCLTLPGPPLSPCRPAIERLKPVPGTKGVAGFKLVCVSLGDPPFDCSSYIPAWWATGGIHRTYVLYCKHR